MPHFTKQGLFGTLAFFAVASLANGAACDVNGDGVITTSDTSAIVAARNTPASGPADPRDPNADGQINVLDARICALRVGTSVGNSATVTVGPSGGTVALADGTSVAIPAGALATSQSITIREIPLPANSVLPVTGKVVGKVYSFEPNGQRFAVPVKITIPYDASALTGYEEGAVSIYRQESDPGFNMVSDETADPEAESAVQDVDMTAKRISVHTTGFSAYAAIAVNSMAAFTPSTLTSGTDSLVVNVPNAGGLRTTRPQQHNCVTTTAQTNLTTRPATDVQAIILHSTNNGNVGRTFNGELGWATDNCNGFFTHYYVDRDGAIYQVADDTRVTQHTRPSTGLGINNGNAIGIELFNNTGEPYDGRMVAATIKLVDFLAQRHNLPRPARNAQGVLVLNRVNITAGGDRIVSHADTDTAKCDPAGTFRDSGTMATVTVATGCGTAAVNGGNTTAPSLVHVVLDAIAVMDRTRQHTGVINTAGGDARGLAAPGAGGNVTLGENPAAVAAAVGNALHTQAAQNAPLIVTAGANSTLSGTVTHTDAIIAGTLTVPAALNLNLTGTLYLAPTGKILLQGNATVNSRGTPILQGLIDGTGVDANASGAAGGDGRVVSVQHASPGILLVPTIITRGGDAQVADGGIGQGGRGGNIAISIGAATAASVGAGKVFVGGGVGPRVVATDPSSARPAIRNTLDPINFSPPEYIGDHLPIFPPFYYSSIGTTTVANNTAIPLRSFAGQAGFTRGLLTSGGFGGGAAATSAANQRGGRGGDGGAITINAGTEQVRFRDVDLITGADVEMATSEIVLPEGGAFRWLFLVPAGGAGGKGRIAAGNRTGGDGGPGGAAGNISVQGALVPAPTTFQPIAGVANPGDIIGFDGQFRLFTTDDLLFDFIIGRAVQANDGAQPLYRLRLDFSGRPLGGSGGGPSGGISGEFPGSAGVKGASGTITGLPTQ